MWRVIGAGLLAACVGAYVVHSALGSSTSAPDTGLPVVLATNGPADDVVTGMPRVQPTGEGDEVKGIYPELDDLDDTDNRDSNELWDAQRERDRRNASGKPPAPLLHDDSEERHDGSGRSHDGDAEDNGADEGDDEGDDDEGDDD